MTKKKKLPHKVAVRVKKLMQVKSLDFRTVPGRGLVNTTIVVVISSSSKIYGIPFPYKIIRRVSPHNCWQDYGMAG